MVDAMNFSTAFNRLLALFPFLVEYESRRNEIWSNLSVQGGVEGGRGDAGDV